MAEIVAGKQPSGQYRWTALLGVGAIVRGLRAVRYEEDRRTRDEALIALWSFRENLGSTVVTRVAIVEYLKARFGWTVDPINLHSIVAAARARVAARGESDPLAEVEAFLSDIKNSEGREQCLTK